VTLFGFQSVFRGKSQSPSNISRVYRPCSILDTLKSPGYDMKAAKLNFQVCSNERLGL